MTEAEWLVVGEVSPMLEFLRDKASDRKLRLFAIACCWDANHWQWEGPASSAALSVAVRYVEGHAIDPELVTAYDAAYQQIGWKLETGEPPWDPTLYAASPNIRDAVRWAAFYSAITIGNYPEPHTDGLAERLFAEESRFQAGLLRDMFGNPFRPVVFDPARRTEHAVGIAGKMYDEREFAAMPILADALEEAGCDNADILSHCREPGVHVRGCWVVDLVLGKE